MKYCLLTFLIIISTVGFSQRNSVNKWISTVDNKSIGGTCHYFWTIEAKNEAVNNLIKAGKPIQKKILKLLDDPNKGVVAHYILSNIYDKTRLQTLEMDSLKVKYNYNGLEFTETANAIIADSLSFVKCKNSWIKEIKR
jgi:hypothetical protein